MHQRRKRSHLSIQRETKFLFWYQTKIFIINITKSTIHALKNKKLIAYKTKATHSSMIIKCIFKEEPNSHKTEPINSRRSGWAQCHRATWTRTSPSPSCSPRTAICARATTSLGQHHRRSLSQAAAKCAHACWRTLNPRIDQQTRFKPD